MEVTVNPATLKKQTTALKSIQSGLNSSASTVQKVRTSLDTSMEAYAIVAKKLRDCDRSLTKLSNSASKMQTGLERIADAYYRVDKSIVAGTSARASIKNGVSARTIGMLLGNLKGKNLKSYGLFSDAEWINRLAFPVGGLLLGPGVIAAGGLHFALKNSGGQKFFNVNTETSSKIKGKSANGEDTIGVEGKAKIEVSVYHDEASAESKYAAGKLEATVGKVAATGALGATMYKNGKLDPSLYAKAKAEAVGIETKASGRLGTKDNNVHGSAKGQVGYAKAEASAGVSKKGVTVKAGAEVAALKGELKGGVSVLGIKFNVGVEGKLGAAGATAEASIGKGGTKGKLGASLGIGPSISWDIDWSGFKLPFK